jgi:Ni,Fe-hydrogenase I small subunit
MGLHKHVFKSVFGKPALVTAALGGLICFAGASSAQAQDRDDYRRPVVRYENRREEAFEHRRYFDYGPRDRYERREAFEHGWRNHHGWDLD